MPFFLIFISIPLWAQAFQDLATTDNGSVLYFSSPVRQTGKTQSFHSKIFRWDAADGFKVVAEVADVGNESDCVAGPNFYELGSPQVSADGSLLAYSGSRPELFPIRLCLPYEQNQGILKEPAGQVTVTGNVAISRNGRYAISTPAAAVAEGVHVVTDLASGLSSVIAGAFNGSQQRVTNDGTILTPAPAAPNSPEPSVIILTDRNGASRILNTRRQVSDAVINPSGTTVAYLTLLTGPNGSTGISLIDVPTGNETDLAAPFGPGNLSLSSDGTIVFYTDGGQLYSVSAGGRPRQITTQYGGVASVAVSGGGTVAYAATGDSRLIRIDIASGAVTELAPSTPRVTAAYRIFPPQTNIAALGSVIQLYGSGIMAVQQIALCGRTVPKLQGQVRFQVPWDLPEGPCQAIVQSSSPFEHGIDLQVQTYDPQFVQINPPAALLLHPNFLLISPSSPAQPGEAIVAYMTGLGPVDASGMVMPGFQCRVGPVDATVLYAGLAPGFTGFYQVNLTVPDLEASSASLTCGWNALMQAATSVWL